MGVLYFILNILQSSSVNMDVEGLQTRKRSISLLTQQYSAAYIFFFNQIGLR